MWKNSLITIAGIAIIVALAGLLRALPYTKDMDAHFYVEARGKGGHPGFTAYGFGWKPNSIVRLQIFNEPNGPESVNTSWKTMFDVPVDSTGMFGTSTSSPLYPVARSICGDPPPDAKAMVIARSIATGRTRVQLVPVDLYYNVPPC
jgi:hypothetical protein